MRQGATPAYVFTLPINASELDLCHITFKQHFRVIAERNLEDCTIDGKKVACTLTEKETLAFLPDCHPAEVQIRCGVGSARFPSQIFKVDVKPALQRSTLAELCGEEETAPTASMPEGEGTAYASQDGWSMAEYDAEFDVDLGELLRGPKGDPGKDGITPTIGENGNWFLGDEDTGKPSRGEKGESAADAVKYTEQNLTDTQKSQARHNIGSFPGRQLQYFYNAQSDDFAIRDDIFAADWGDVIAPGNIYTDVNGNTNTGMVFPCLVLSKQYLSGSTKQYRLLDAAGASWTVTGYGFTGSTDRKYYTGFYEIQKMSPTIGPLTVTFTPDDDGNWSADKTFAEVKAAIEAGRFVQATDGTAPFSVYGADNTQILFRKWDSYTDGAFTITITLTSTDGVSVEAVDAYYVDKQSLEQKTDDMTQPVGVDEDGKLWTARELPEPTAEKYGYYAWIAKNADGTPVWEATSLPLRYIRATYSASSGWTFKDILTGGTITIGEIPTRGATGIEYNGDLYQQETTGDNSDCYFACLVKDGSKIIRKRILLDRRYGSAHASQEEWIAPATVDADGNISGSANDLITIAALNATGAKFAAMIPTIPTALKNPNALTIKIGSETVTYDGSAAKTVEIADGTEVSY